MPTNRPAHAQTSDDERLQRRASRRRQIRRRRLAGVVLLVALSVGVVTAAAQNGTRHRRRRRSPRRAASARRSSRPGTSRGGAPQRQGRGRCAAPASRSRSPSRATSTSRARSASGWPRRRPASSARSRRSCAARTSRSSTWRPHVTERGSPQPKDSLPGAGQRVRGPRGGRGRRREPREQPRAGLRAHGLRDTLASAKRAAFPVVGMGWNDDQAYAPYRQTVRGQRIAIIGATQVLDDHLVASWTAGPRKAGIASAKNDSRLRPIRRGGARDQRHRGGLPPLGRRARPLPVRLAAVARRAAPHAPAPTSSSGRTPTSCREPGGTGSAFVAYGLGNFVFYASRGGRPPDRRAQGDGDRTPGRRLPLGAGTDLRRHPRAADRPGAHEGARELERTACLHGPQALTNPPTVRACTPRAACRRPLARPRDASAERRPSKRSRNGAPSPESTGATKSSSLSTSPCCDERGRERRAALEQAATARRSPRAAQAPRRMPPSAARARCPRQRAAAEREPARLAQRLPRHVRRVAVRPPARFPCPPRLRPTPRGARGRSFATLPRSPSACRVP